MDLTIPLEGKEPAKGFDYSVMDKNTAKFAETKAAEIWQRHDRMIGDWMANAETYEAVAERMVQARNGKAANRHSAKTFKDWVERETPYKAETVGQMRLAYKRLRAALEHGSTSAIPWRNAQALTEGNTSEPVIKAVLARIKTGDTVTQREIGRINKAARKMDDDTPLLSPKKANQVARETGQPQVASDGRLYLGLSPEEVAHGKAQNKLDFGIIDGVAFFSSIEISPEEWLDPENSALMEWPVTDPPKIKEAATWLMGLANAWPEYAKAQAVNGGDHETAK